MKKGTELKMENMEKQENLVQEEKKVAKSRVKRNLLIFGGVVLGVFLIAGLFSVLGGSDTETTPYPEEPYIARLNVEGTIQASGNEDYFGNAVGYQHQWTLDTID